MFWYNENLGTCNYYNYESLRVKENPEIEFIIVWDLIDGYQDNWGQFMSKVQLVEKALKKGKKVIVVCRGGMSRSNAVVLAYLLKSGLDWYEANEVISKNLVTRIEENLKDQIRQNLTSTS